MSKNIAPLLYINLCAETVYVIEQRLIAQNIASSKSASILSDMIEYLFLPSRLKEMFEPQEAPTLLAAKSLMESLVNCSVMKVTGESMSKLCDLAITLFKFQITCSTRVDQLLEITRLHLNGLDTIRRKGDDTRTLPLIAAALSRFNEAYSGRSVGELHRMRQCLLQTLQEQRIKVSLLMELQVQSKETAAFTLPAPLAANVGRVTYYDESGGKEGRQERIQVTGASQVAPGSFLDHPAPLGSNLFAKGPDRLFLPSRHLDAHLLAPVVPPAIDGSHFSPVLVE